MRTKFEMCSLIRW